MTDNDVSTVGRDVDFTAGQIFQHKEWRHCYPYVSYQKLPSRFEFLACLIRTSLCCKVRSYSVKHATSIVCTARNSDHKMCKHREKCTC